MTRADLLETDPITLLEASRVVLRGVVSVSALRAEIKRGNLMVERIGKNIFTTPAAIREMRTKCRVQPRPLACTSEKTETAGSGSSGTTASIDELTAMRMSLKALKGNSRNTSRKNMHRGPDEAASPIPFPSQRS